MYNIIGSDGRQYGPVSLADLQQWAQQGRIQATTQVQLEGAPDWRTAAAVPELAALFAAPAAAGAAVSAGVPKTSGLAIASLALGILGFCSAGLLGLAGIITGAIALSKISKSQGQLSGKGLAVGGLCAGVLSLIMIPVLAAMLLPALAQAKAQAQRINCMNNLKQLGLAVRIYANDYNDTMPKAENWCDAINSYAGSPVIFRCPSHAQDGQRSHYSFNAKLSGIKDSAVRDPANTVMIFESAGGWNASGGPNEARAMHRGKNVSGAVLNIAFVDGSVRMVRQDELARLRWDP